MCFLGLSQAHGNVTSFDLSKSSEWTGPSRCGWIEVRIEALCDEALLLECGEKLVSAPACQYSLTGLTGLDGRPPPPQHLVCQS